MHAAKRYQIRCALVDTHEGRRRSNDPYRIEVASASGNAVSRDAAVIGIADQVDAPFVRRGGTIESCLRQWLGLRVSPSVQVVVGRKGSAARELVERGARSKPPMMAQPLAAPRRGAATQFDGGCVDDDRSWVAGERWLVHCTRGCHGPWPDETVDAFRDAMFDDDARVVDRDAFAALSRIVRTRRLIAGAKASANDYPVVCFSAVPLKQLLQRRCYRRHLHRWDYEPYGIAIRLEAAQRIGIRPVVYADSWEQSGLASAERFRFQRRGRSTDWSAEKEWRSPRTVDLNFFSRREVRVFVHHSARTRLDRLAPCLWPITLIPNETLESR